MDIYIKTKYEKADYSAYPHPTSRADQRVMLKKIEEVEEKIAIEFYKHGLSVPYHDERTFTLSEFREAVFNLLKEE
jgi:hypothetical protein